MPAEDALDLALNGREGGTGGAGPPRGRALDASLWGTCEDCWSGRIRALCGLRGILVAFGARAVTVLGFTWRCEGALSGRGLTTFAVSIAPPGDVVGMVIGPSAVLTAALEL